MRKTVVWFIFSAILGIASLGAQNYPSAWNSLGPVNMLVPYETSMGRVNCVAGSPGNPNKLYLGTPGGGIWSSNDGGTNWYPCSDAMPVLAVSSLVVDPSHTNTLYLATGDADSAGLNSYSIGVWKSMDGGTNWSATGLTWTLDNYLVIYKLIIDPANSLRLFAATTGGLYSTVDGGTNWQKALPGGNDVWYDVQFQPGNSSVVYLTGQGANYFRSTNGGTNWTQITAGLPGSGIDRSALGVSAANPQGLYLLYGDSSTGGFKGVYQSTDGGSSFTLQASSALTNFMFDAQEGYDFALAASPTNFNEVYLAGNLIGRSTDGGLTWQSVPYDGTHVDVHGLYFVNGALFACTDGGIHKTTDHAASWQDLSLTLQIAQIYNVGGAPQNPSLIYVGEQDDGLNQYANGMWTHLQAGDYGQPVVDPIDQNTVYATAHGYYLKTTDAWASSTPLQITSSENAGFESPLIMSSADHRVLYAGFQNVWETTNAGSTWFPISSFSDSSVCSAIFQAPSNPNYLYVVRGGSLWRTTDGGTTWANISSTFEPVAVAISSSDPNKIWVAQNNLFGAKTSRIYASINGGTNWTAFGGSLPNRTVNCLVYEGGSNDGLYAGFDAGVYYRDAGMADWQTFSTNLPNARVVDLQINYVSLKLRAATFGRGLWETYLAGAGPASPMITGPGQPQVGAGNAYSFTAVAKAMSYQWEQTLEIPFNLTDGAENGLTNFTATISSGYSAISTTLRATGTNSFHLAHPHPIDQILELNYPLLAQTNSTLQFKSYLGFSTPTQVAKAQISTDSGNSWLDVYSQPGGNPETAFTTKVIPLGNYAGQTIQVRFDYNYQGGSYYPQTVDSFGWYLDDVSFSNFQELTNQTLTAVPTGTNYVFTPSVAGTYRLQVRAITYGPSFQAFGQPLVVTASSVVIPTLAFAKSGGLFTLSWTDPTFVLEQTSKLSPPAWTLMSSNSPANATIGTVGAQFFRLRR